MLHIRLYVTYFERNHNQVMKIHSFANVTSTFYNTVTILTFLGSIKAKSRFYADILSQLVLLKLVIFSYKYYIKL